MKNIRISEKQAKRLKKNIKETHEQGSYMAKKQLFTIATLAYKMWEMMEEGEELEDWMTSKLAQAEQSMVSVFKAFMYDEFENKMGRDI